MSQIHGKARVASESIELREHTVNGKTRYVAEFNVYITKYTAPKNGGDWSDEGYFARLSIWDEYAEACAALLSKGDMVRVVGSLSMDKWTGEDGEKRKELRIKARAVDPVLTHIAELAYKARGQKPDEEGE